MREFSVLNNFAGMRISVTSLVLAGALTSTFVAAPVLADTPKIEVAHRTIAYVDLIAAGAMQKRFYDYFLAGTDALGWEVILQDANGDPTKANTAAIALINQGIDALVTSCNDTAPMRPALELAKSKGIPTVQIGCPMSDEAAWDLSLPINDTGVGNALGQYIAGQMTDGGKIGILGDTTIIAGNVRTAGLMKGLEGTKIEVVGNESVSLTDPAGGSRKTVSTFLTANPDLSGVVAIYDFFAPPAGNTLISAGVADKVSVYSFYADAVNVPYMRTEGSPLKAVADGPVEIVSLIAVDQLVRHFESGEGFDSSVAATTEVPFEIFTQDNLPAASDDYLTPYDVQPHLDTYLAAWAAAYPGK